MNAKIWPHLNKPISLAVKNALITFIPSMISLTSWWIRGDTEPLFSKEEHQFKPPNEHYQKNEHPPLTGSSRTDPIPEEWSLSSYSRCRAPPVLWEIVSCQRRLQSVHNAISRGFADCAGDTARREQCHRGHCTTEWDAWAFWFPSTSPARGGTYYSWEIVIGRLSWSSTDYHLTSSLLRTCKEDIEYGSSEMWLLLRSRS